MGSRDAADHQINLAATTGRLKPTGPGARPTGTPAIAHSDTSTDALVDPDPYAARYPDCNRVVADIDESGVTNFADIDPFVALLLGE